MIGNVLQQRGRFDDKNFEHNFQNVENYKLQLRSFFTGRFTK